MRFASACAPILLAFLMSPSFAAPRPLPPAEAKFKRENLAKIDGTEGSVLSESGAKIWREAIRIAAKYEDPELMGAMLSAWKTSDGAPAEMLPEYLFDVYQRNPAFYVKSALAYHKGEMDRVAGEFVNEMTDKTTAELEAPIKKIGSKSSDRLLLDRFLAAARKLRSSMTVQQDSRVAKICRSQSYPIGQTVTFRAQTQCDFYEVNGVFLGEACLKSKEGASTVVYDAKIDNPSKLALGPCGKRRTFTGKFDPLPSTKDSPHPFIFKLEKIQ